MVAAVLPVALIAVPRARRSPRIVGTAAAFAVLGLLWNRLDVGIFGYFRDAGTVYLPSVIEWAVSLGVIAAAVLAFLYAVENLPIFDGGWRRRQEARRRFSPAFDRASMVWRTALGRGLDRVTLLAVFALALGWVVMYPPFHPGRRGAGATRRSRRWRWTSSAVVLRLDANRARMAVEFPHRDHQQRLGKEASCVRCHHLALPGDHSTPCSRCHRDMERATDIFRPQTAISRPLPSATSRRACIPRITSALSATTGTARSAGDAKPCLECHRKDMVPEGALEEPDGNMRWVVGYRAAMHGTCVRCHEREKDRVERPALADCSNCHAEIRRRPVDTPLDFARTAKPEPRSGS